MPAKCLGTAWGRTLGGMVAALALLAGSEAGAATRTGIQPVASAWIGVFPILAGGEPALEVRAAALTTWPDDANEYGARGAFHEYNFIQVSQAQAQELAEALDAWVDAPHSEVVYQQGSPDNKTGLGFSGLAIAKGKADVVLTRLSYWIGPGRNGGIFIALPEAEVRLLAGAMRDWVAAPVPGGGAIYLRQAAQ